MSRAERRLNGKKGAHISWANTEDPTARTAPARDARLENLKRQVDPEGKLSEAERTRRADQLRRAWLADLAAKSARARRMRKQQVSP